VGSHYTVKLPKALNLSSGTLNEGASRWQVAMMDCHYMHNFYNLRQGCTLRIIVAMPAASEISMSEAASPACLVADHKLRWFLISDMIDKQLLNTFHLIHSERGRIMDVHRGLYGVVYVPAAYYSSISALLDHLTNEFNKLFEPRFNQSLSASVNDDGTILFSVSSGKQVAIFADTPYIANVLGLSTKELPLILWIDGKDVDIKLHRLNLVGALPPKLDRVHAVHIYGDIIEHQYVGNTMAPLLGYVDVPDTLGERVSHTCNPLVYLPVNRSIINTITIRIRDERGNDVTFPDDVSNVIVRLHFRESAM
jgi:hypothetical protein